MRIETRTMMASRHKCVTHDRHAHAEPWAWHPGFRLFECTDAVTYLMLLYLVIFTASVRAEGVLNELTDKEKRDLFENGRIATTEFFQDK